MRYLLIIALLLGTGCATAQRSVSTGPNVPMPPQNAQEVALTDNATTQMPEKQDTYIYPVEYGELSDGPRADDPAELAELLEMQAPKSIKENSAVNLLRPSAIRDAARLVTIQTALSWRYAQLLRETYRHESALDKAFNFGPLMMTQGDTLIMPPVLTQAGASMRIEEGTTATTAKTTYELLAAAAYVSVVPNWRSYLMTEGFPEPEKPNPAVLPKNDKERRIWRAAVREAWALGVEEAGQLYKENVARMTRDYRGIMLYHLLTAQHLLTQVNVAESDLGIHVKNEKMHLGQKVYRITRPSRFVVPGGE